MTTDRIVHHRVQPWTVAQLRAALDGLPGHMPIRVCVAREPGGEIVDIQVVIDAGLGVVVEPDGTEWIADEFEINCEFPSGDYRLDEVAGPQ